MRLVLATVVSLAACGTSDSGPELLPGFDPGPPPENGTQIIMAPVRNLVPGVSHEICSWTGIPVDSDLDVRKIQAFQLAGGHHVALYVTKVALPAGTSRECTDADMTNFRFVAGTANDGTPNEAPGDLVYRLPKGTTIAVQHHYINASDKVVDSQSALNIYYADKGTTYTPSASMAILDTNLTLPPGASSKDVHCTMNRDLDAWFSIPHMHRYGVSFSATLTHDNVAKPIVAESTWDPGYEFHPPETYYDLATPLSLKTGDSIDVHCGWNNTTDGTLKFGNEMCVFFAATIDRTNAGNVDCDGGDWGSF
jgi:hypothetical protein